MANISKANQDEWAALIATLIDQAMTGLEKEGRPPFWFNLDFYGASGQLLKKVDFSMDGDTTDPDALAEEISLYSNDTPIKVVASSPDKNGSMLRTKWGSTTLQRRDSSLAGGIIAYVFFYTALVAVPIAAGVAGGQWVWHKIQGKKQ